MFVYGKTSANAISIMSFLAANVGRRCGSREISRTRKVSMPLTAKLLSQLSSAGLVDGQPGPGGGYTLAVPAERIRLIDIVRLFEQTTDFNLCPFGTGWCGVGEPCPLHEDLLRVAKVNSDFLENTSIAVFMRE